MNDIKEIISDPKYQRFKSLGIIDEIGVRNLKIKKDYQELRTDHSIFEAESILAEKYCLSESTIHSILFRKRNRKKLSQIEISSP